MEIIKRLCATLALSSFVLNPMVGFASSNCSHKKKSDCEQHDYIIVGGGTAGLTLGYLLRKAKYDVVVLEAGRNVDTDPNILNAKPLNDLEVNFRNQYFWTGDAEPLLPSESRSTNVHANHYSGGRVSGGTSSTNDTIWWRMQQQTFNKAGGIFANPVYMDKIFKAVETYTGTSQSPAKRGTVGPILTTQGPSINGVLETNPISPKFNQAIQTVFQNDYNTAIPLVIDGNVVNGPFLANYGQFSINPSTLQRCSASIGLLARKYGKKLDLRLDAQVTKIGFKGKRATSVTYLQNNVIHKIKAKKKIILSAGHLTPSLLLQNGIGDASLLESLDIKVVYDNPEVGKNMKNHIFLPFTISINPADAAVLATYPLAFKRVMSGGSIPEPGNPLSNNGRDYQIGLLGAGGNFAALIIVFVNPQSTGTVSIAAKDPLMAPVVDLNYLSEPADVNSMITAVTIANRVMQELHAIDPTYNMLSNTSNPAAYVNANTSAFHHWHGQALIGRVVDENLNVMGVKNLMVADLTIFPQTDGNTQTMGYAAGCAAYTLITGDQDVSFE